MSGLSTHPVTHHPAVALLLWVILVVMLHLLLRPMLYVLWCSMLCIACTVYLCYLSATARSHAHAVGVLMLSTMLVGY